MVESQPLRQFRQRPDFFGYGRCREENKDSLGSGIAEIGRQQGAFDVVKGDFALLVPKRVARKQPSIALEAGCRVRSRQQSRLLCAKTPLSITVKSKCANKRCIAAAVACCELVDKPLRNDV